MTNSQLALYILQSLNMALGSQMQGETSYTNSFDVKVETEGFYFIPRLPAGYIIDDDLYQKIFLIAMLLFTLVIPYLNNLLLTLCHLIPTIFIFSVRSSSLGSSESQNV